MTDVYVYHFLPFGPSGGRERAHRRATLAAIARQGEAIMESQIVVDHTEVDADGFLIGHADEAAHPTDRLWSQIRSLERRAQSRDAEALALTHDSEAGRRYLLHLESRELRKQADALHRERADSRSHDANPKGSWGFGSMAGGSGN